MVVCTGHQALRLTQWNLPLSIPIALLPLLVCQHQRCLVAVLTQGIWAEAAMNCIFILWEVPTYYLTIWSDSPLRNWLEIRMLLGCRWRVLLQEECWLIGRLLDSFEFHQENRDHVRLASFPVCVLGRRLLSDQTTSDQTRHYQTTSDHVRSNPISPAIDWLIDLTYMLLGTASAHNCAVTGVAEMMCVNVAKIYEQDFVCMFYQCM